MGQGTGAAAGSIMRRAPCRSRCCSRPAGRAAVRTAPSPGCRTSCRRRVVLARPPMRTRFAFARQLGSAGARSASPFSCEEALLAPREMKLSAPNPTRERPVFVHASVLLRDRPSQSPESDRAPFLLRAGHDPELQRRGYVPRQAVRVPFGPGRAGRCGPATRSTSNERGAGASGPMFGWRLALVNSGRMLAIGRRERVRATAATVVLTACVRPTGWPPSGPRDRASMDASADALNGCRACYAELVASAQADNDVAALESMLAPESLDPASH